MLEEKKVGPPVAKEIATHYGYSELALSRGCWPIDETTLARLKSLPDVLKPEKKFRVTFDYDPEYGFALLQVFQD